MSDGIPFATFATRLDGLCRWPLAGADRYCGCRTDGRSPYCADHHQRAIRKDHAGTGTTYPGWGDLNGNRFPKRVSRRGAWS
jgi:hypothetical protein